MAITTGERPQHVVPAGDWFAAEPAAGSSWSLVSCTVAPGFDFADFELARAEQLLEHDTALSRLCDDWRRLCAAA
jgi:predicted cupin superfamily sugar epimerase